MVVKDEKYSNLWRWDKWKMGFPVQISTAPRHTCLPDSSSSSPGQRQITHSPRLRGRVMKTYFKMYYFKLTFSKYVTENWIFCSKVFLVTLSKKPGGYNYWVYVTTCCCHHSHKKRTDSLEAHAELTVLRTYIENQFCNKFIK